MLEELAAKPGEAITVVWAILVGHIGRFLFKLLGRGRRVDGISLNKKDQFE